MSTPSNLTEEQKRIWDWAMKAPLYRRNDIVDKGEFEVKLLEESLAHGCPKVKRLDTGEEYYCTMYGHGTIVDSLFELVEKFRENKVG